MEIKRANRNFQRTVSNGILTVMRYPVFGVLIAFLVVFIIFSILAPNFFTVDTLTGVFSLVAELGIITIGEAFLIISGEFDLSVSGVYTLSASIFVVMSTFMHSGLALLIALVFAACIGFINGKITLKTGIPSFITTLGMMMITRGSLLAATGGRSLSYRGDSFVPTMLSKIFGSGFRPSHIWFIVIALIFSFILLRTRYGNWVLATGGDKETARAQGVRTDRVKLINFIICAVLAGFAGCIAISRFKFANVAFGTGYELEAIAAAVIGGTFLFGGYGTIIGAALGAFLISMIRIGLVMIGIPGYYYQSLVGIILIAAAVINLRIRKLWF
ncbi:MAG: ABC transporter permease [Spirochaetota bacterium]